MLKKFITFLAKKVIKCITWSVSATRCFPFCLSLSILPIYGLNQEHIQTTFLGVVIRQTDVAE